MGQYSEASGLLATAGSSLVSSQASASVSPTPAGKTVSSAVSIMMPPASAGSIQQEASANAVVSLSPQYEGSHSSG
jgi:hypothetical protein